MHSSYILLGCLSTIIQGSPLPSPSTNLLKSLNLAVDELGATAFSLIYGSPLLNFKQLAGPIVEGPGTNQIGHLNATATASTRNVVRPNVDTIYGTAILDLSATDLVFTLPPMEEDRFYAFGFFDPYGDNFISLGSVPASAPGKYLIRYSDSCCNGYTGCITFPTAAGTILGRVEVKNNSADELFVDSYLTKATLTAINPRKASLPALTSTDFAGLSSNTAISVLQLTARLESRAIPEDALFKAAIPAILALAGITDGSYDKPACVNLTEAAALANFTIAAFQVAPSSYIMVGNGWSTWNNKYAGTFESGTDIVARAVVAVALYLQNTPNEAVYPTLGSTQTSLTDAESYVFTFSGKPPIAADGFWSMTMYDDSGYLVANKENTWAVGDRSNITYPNSDLVYSDDAKDGTFQVLVQDANISPPSNWTKNWLPAPSGGGTFTVTFRLYAPETAAKNGSYGYPVVTKGPAIIG